MLREPIGFVVEGHGEYNCYPSLFCKIINGSGFNIPRVNAGGYGGITKRLGEQLTDLCMMSSPLHVIVTIDFIDIMRSGLFSDCESLRINLDEQAEAWLESAASDPRISDLPESVTIVIQIQKFEAWLISDVDNLINSNILTIGSERLLDADVVSDPAQWLRENIIGNYNIKNPAFARTIVAALDPEVMKDNSQSFDKFYRTVTAKYSEWLTN